MKFFYCRYEKAKPQRIRNNRDAHMNDIYLSLEKYRSSFRRMRINTSEELEWFYSMLIEFLDRFDWVLSYTATDIGEQEKRGDERFKGVCYDACKYLAQKLEKEGIEYKAYWICGYDRKSISRWFSGQPLHSFNICKIDDGYYFADCFFAPLITGSNSILCFDNEKDALAWACEFFLPKSPFVLREFKPLDIKMGSHILYSLRRLFNLRY
jgi:hypothetical protein